MIGEYQDNSMSRDDFAARAMAAMISPAIDLADPVTRQWIAARAYLMADAMIAERSK